MIGLMIILLLISEILVVVVRVLAIRPLWFKVESGSRLPYLCILPIKDPDV